MSNGAAGLRVCGMLARCWPGTLIAQRLGCGFDPLDY